MATQGASAPARLGRYELLARLATGGMGEIFLARLQGAAGFEKLFVVKRILPHLADDARFRGMLIAEAQIASKMAHANICQVNELGETDGQLYIVMEYLEGITLLPMLRRCSKENSPLDFGFVGGIVQQATDALHYAHELRDRSGEYLGIVHRDVTPSNIFLTESGVAKLLDFGIAKVKDASAHTQTGTVKGKYAYMAPEQLRGGNVDRRADVFALGIVTYEMLALRRLFQRKTDYLTFRAVMEQPIPDVRRYRPDVPDALAEALNRALDRDPEQRFMTARLFGTTVMDALGMRPWSQGEISDYVRAHFAQEIHKRSSEISNALHRTKPGNASAGRLTMPLIAADEPALSDQEDYDEDEFPSVESTLSDAPPLAMLRRPSSASGQPSDFVGSTPPPFAGEASTGSGAALRALTPAPTPTGTMPSVTVHKRNWLWPLLAVLAVGVAGGALFLVWKQMQQQQPPPVVNITAAPANPPQAPPEEPIVTPPPVEDPVEPAVKPTKPTTKIDKPAVQPPKKSPYDLVLQQQRPKLNACAQEHGAPGERAKVTIMIAPNGKAKTVSIDPAKLNGTPLGACIKNVLSVAEFPKAAGEVQVGFDLKPT